MENRKEEVVGQQHEWAGPVGLTRTGGGGVHGAGLAAAPGALGVTAHAPALTTRGPGSKRALDPQRWNKIHNHI